MEYGIGMLEENWDKLFCGKYNGAHRRHMQEHADRQN
jgi:hypothetical protein